MGEGFIAEIIALGKNEQKGEREVNERKRA